MGLPGSQTLKTKASDLFIDPFCHMGCNETRGLHEAVQSGTVASIYYSLSKHTPTLGTLLHFIEAMFLVMWEKWNSGAQCPVIYVTKQSTLKVLFL